ncbi:MAG: hypothetical protein AB7F08_04170 [Dongiaceae bacterium]
MRIGDILVASGVVTKAQVDQALQRQKSAGGRLGDNLVALGAIGNEDLDGVLNEIPASPRSIAETGVSEGTLLNMLLKLVYARNLDTTSKMSDELMLPAALINTLLAEAERRQLVEVLGKADGVLSEIRYTLSATGRRRASEAFEVSQYIGPAPIPFTAYQTRILRQRITNERIGRPDVDIAFGDLTVPKDFIDRLGPGINSGRAILLYGPAGNGKTSVAERIARIFKGIIYVPYCIEVEGQLIKVFDPTLHEAVPQSKIAGSHSILRDDFDRRWVPCKRPVVITGGELTLEMLDLQYNATARFYEAPLHVKALGGTFIIDDFGRQLVSPEQLLNRWIVPMQSRVDYLKLHTGKSFSLPFDELIIFSTNMDPSDLMDPAFLRRIPYKLETAPPSLENYREIFRRVAEIERLAFDDEVLQFVLKKLTVENSHPLACYQPRFIVDQVLSACKYEGIPPTFSRERIAVALDNLYVKRKHQPAAAPQSLSRAS